MHFRYDKSKLQQIIQAFSTLTGIGMAFLDSQYNYLCKISDNHFCAAIQKMRCNKGKCSHSDRFLLSKCSESHTFECHFCHAGLYDACMPIIKDQALAGYVLMGQIRHASGAQICDFDDPSLEKLYYQIPCFTDEQLAAIKTLLPEILFQNAIQFDDSTSEIIQYIKEHLQEPLTLETICSKFHISKNSLYQRFHEVYGCTVNAYITKLRIEAAKTCLCESSDPVYLIAEKVGINNYTYFCRLFKQHTGFTPGQYRNNATVQRRLSK